MIALENDEPLPIWPLLPPSLDWVDSRGSFAKQVYPKPVALGYSSLRLALAVPGAKIATADVVLASIFEVTKLPHGL